LNKDDDHSSDSCESEFNQLDSSDEEFTLKENEKSELYSEIKELKKQIYAQYQKYPFKSSSGPKTPVKEQKEVETNDC
jgi:hypothetical protein